MHPEMTLFTLGHAKISSLMIDPESDLNFNLIIEEN